MNVKILFGAIGAFILGIIAFIFGRGSNGSGVRRVDDNIRDIRTGFDEQRDINSEVGRQHGVIKQTITEVRRNNDSAIGAIRRAKKILQMAKDRKSNSLD